MFVVVFMMVQRRGKELFYRAANTDGAMLGKWSGFGAEGTKGIFVWATSRRREGLMMVGGFVRS